LLVKTTNGKRSSCAARRRRAPRRRPRRANLWMHAALALAALACGCLSRPAAGSVAHDGPSGDAAIPPCKTPLIFDDFQGTTPCCTWGTAASGGFTSQGGGALVITIPPHTNGVGGCAMTVPMAFDASGTFVEVASLLAVGATSTSLEITSPTSLLHVYLDAIDGMLVLRED